MVKQRNPLENINERYGKLPPQAVDIEEAIIGVLINDAQTYDKISSIISENCFYKEEHQKIYSEIKAMNEANKPVDILTLKQQLSDKGILDVVGGFTILFELSNKGILAYNSESYARIIKQKFIQREAIRLSTEIEVMAYDDSEDIEDLLNFMDNGFSALVDGLNLADMGKTMFDVSNNTWEEIQVDYERAKAGKLAGIPTGFFQLNAATGGWRSPNNIIIAARPSIGKTSLMLHFAMTAAEAGYWVNLYGYEMTAEDLWRIILSGKADINRTRLRDGKLTPDELQEVKRVLDKLKALPILWYDKGDAKPSTIKSRTKQNRRKGKCDILMVDYLQIVPAEDDKKAREEQISKTSRTLKSITLSCHIPVISLAQLNRDIEKRSNPKPFLSDLRESGSIEQDADIVIMPYRDTNGNLILSIAKQRRGKIGDIPIESNDEMTKFFDEAPEGFSVPEEVFDRYEKDKPPTPF